MKRYLSFNDYFKNKFGKKVIKLSLDMGSTCPNRDGTLSNLGCIFCSEKGSGDFAASRLLSIDNQIQSQKEFLSHKWNDGLYIAYFQNFTNTYGDIDKLEKIFNHVISRDDIVGLSIATRADCLNDDVLKMLDELNKKTFLWLEIGMQTIHDSSLNLINRGYDHDTFDKNIKKLKKLNIKFLTHIIFGLPFETKEMMLKTIGYVKEIHPFGIKFHCLYLENDSRIYKYYKENPFEILSLEDYVELVTESIKKLPKDIVIHRLTGDANREKLIAPLWAKDKLKVIGTIEKELKIKSLPLLK